MWEPLLGVYQQLGESTRLVKLIDQTAPLVDSLPDRARLRLEQAKVLLKDGAIDNAVEILRQIAEEQPSLEQAAELLTGILEKQGRIDELVVLLTSQLDAAKDRQDVRAIVDVSRRLGGLLEQQKRTHDALDVYFAVLDWDKTNPEILRSVLRLAELHEDPFDGGRARGPLECGARTNCGRNCETFSRNAR